MSSRCEFRQRPESACQPTITNRPKHPITARQERALGHHRSVLSHDSPCCGIFRSVRHHPTIGPHYDPTERFPAYRTDATQGGTCPTISLSARHQEVPSGACRSDSDRLRPSGCAEPHRKCTVNTIHTTIPRQLERCSSELRLQPSRQSTKKAATCNRPLLFSANRRIRTTIRSCRRGYSRTVLRGCRASLPPRRSSLEVRT